MEKEVAKCPKCATLNEVKVSSGHSKPENAGKKYFTCINPACKQFSWVENGEAVHASGLRQQQTQQPMPTNNSQSDEFSGWKHTSKGTSSVDAKVFEAKDRMNMYQSALKAATEIVAAQINTGLATYDPQEEVLRLSDVFYKKLESHRFSESNTD